MTITKADLERLHQQVKVQKRLKDAVGELHEALGGTREEAEALAIASIHTTTKEVWDHREYLLREFGFRWFPDRLWELKYWLSERWPRRWLPRLKGEKGRC